jgi:DNA invertase Pin-like site-specific DNA recombinase
MPVNDARPRRIALYARCSTDGQTTETQLHALRAYAEVRGFEVAGEYADHGVSGIRRERPALGTLLAHAKRGHFSMVAVQRLDRLGRSLHHLLDVLGELEALGVDLVGLDDAIDTRTPAGRLFMQIRGAFAEYERTLNVERTRSGLASARRRGVRLGRPPTDRKTRERIVRLRESGRTVAEAATMAGVSPATAERVLRAHRAAAQRS